MGRTLALTGDGAHGVTRPTLLARTEDLVNGGELNGNADPSREGGWWCYGRCQRFVELNMDREVNVCGRCRRPTIAWKAPVQGRLKIEGRHLSEREAHEWFERMRREVEGLGVES